MARRGGSMNVALKGQCAAVRALLTKVGSDEIRTRYRVGTIVLRIQAAPSTYGTRGVDRMADALACDRATLYRHGQVARCFDRRTVDRLLAASRRCNSRISWSHLVVLATVERPEQRAALLERAIEGLSVRELERLARSGAASVLVPSGAASALRHLLAMTESLKGRATADVDIDLETETFDRDLLDLLGRLVSAHRELREICDRKVRHFEELHTQVAEQLTPSGVLPKSQTARSVRGAA